MRFSLFVTLLALSSSILLSRAYAAPAAKNVLFLIADDLNASLGCYGHSIVKTPNIDRLAAKAVRFENAACQFPLCGPSRNSMLTGLHPNTNGIQSNGQLFRQTIPTQVSMPQAFRQQGYLAARIGKLYHYNVPNSIGTNGHDDPASWELEINPAGCDRLIEHPLITSLTPNQFGGTLSWLASDQPDEKHTDGLQAREAAWVLERCGRQKDRPFFLAVGFFRPHTPYVAPKKWFAGYPIEKIPLVTRVQEDQTDIPPSALLSYKKEQDKLTDDTRRAAIQAYFASISFLDAQVGHVLDSLDQNGLTDSTVIVFTSDHGYHLGEHGLWQKQSLFEESARVPLLIAAPGIQPGVSRAPAGLIDLFPTLAELCSVKTPANLQGQSLVPMLKDPQNGPGRGWVISQVVRGGGFKRAGASPAVGDDVERHYGYSIRTTRHRYTEWDEGRRGRELYNHENDPKELTNLAEQPEHAQTVARLSTQLRAAIATTLPPDGKTPQIAPGDTLWAPLLVDP
ncbi:MAG: sulfatase [Verrucomicrobiaceae bacterium]|nr:sulfatase [Verrucomicrobiaceae bacterium]